MTEFDLPDMTLPQPNLLTVVQSFLKIKTFVEGGELTKTLKTFGDIYTDAAIHKLENINKIKPENRSAVLIVVLDNLLLAHLLYYKARIKLGEYTSAYRLIFSFGSYEAEHKDLTVCCLIAILHAYLEDEVAMIERALVWGACALKKVAIKEKGRGNSYVKISKLKKFGLVSADASSRFVSFFIVITFLWNPFIYKAYYDKNRFQNKHQIMTEEDFLAFSKNLGFSMYKLVQDIEKNVPYFPSLDERIDPPDKKSDFEDLKDERPQWLKDYFDITKPPYH